MNITMKKFNFQNIELVGFIFDNDYEHPMFLGKNVAEILGYKNTSEAIGDHTFPSARKVLKYCDTSDLLLSKVRAFCWSGNDKRDKIFITEAGLYQMIFGSKLPAAEEFTTWVAETVLPSIRQNGGYIDGQENLNSRERDILLNEIKILSDAVEKTVEERNRIAKKWHKAVGDKKHLLEKVKIQKLKISRQKSDIAILNRDADDFYDIYTKVLEELAEAENMIRVLKDKMSPAPKKAAKPVIPETGNTFTITTDREGRVIGIA